MMRPAFAFLLLLFAFLSAPQVGAETAATPRITEWALTPSPMIDAALLVGVLSGDNLQQKHYAAEIARFEPRLSAEGRDAIERLGALYSIDGNGLAGPTFAFYLAAILPASLDDAIAALAAPEEIVAKTAGVSAADDDKVFVQAAPDLRTALIALRGTGFAEDYAARIAPAVAAKSALLQADLDRYDIIPEQSRLLGRELEPRIEVLVLHYNAPYGIRVFGQRFVTHHAWNYETTLRVAAHEVFHPPFDVNDETLWQAAKPLEESAYMQSLLKKRNLKWGYDDFRAILNEDSTQALDKVVGTRLGFAPDPGDYWRKQDDGMHVLAAALYQAMTETGFAEKGGRYDEWLKNALKTGTLSEAEVKRRAALIIGEPAVAKWAANGE